MFGKQCSIESTRAGSGQKLLFLSLGYSVAKQTRIFMYGIKPWKHGTNPDLIRVIGSAVIDSATCECECASVLMLFVENFTV